MQMLRYLTAGESHGKALVALVDGFPAGRHARAELIDAELRRRQGGYGRGGRQQIETDHVDILSGVWRGITLGSPIALLIPNKDYKIDADGGPCPAPARPRRPERLDQVSDFGPRDPGAGQRPGNGRPRGRRRTGQATARAAGHHVPWATWSGVGPDDDRRRKPGTLDQQRALRDQSILYTLNPEPGRRDQGR